MTTLILDDKLAERLTQIAASQGRTLDDLATETLQHVADTAQLDTLQAAAPVPEPTEGERLLALLNPYWEEQVAHPERFQPDTHPQPFGDHVEEFLWNHWAEDIAKENSR